jgi:3D (Asp-Asp-Asp) domain-containing protein
MTFNKHAKPLVFDLPSVFPVGARVLVDGIEEAIVKQAFPEGSTSYGFPHYVLKHVGDGEQFVVQFKRVGVARRKP